MQKFLAVNSAEKKRRQRAADERREAEQAQVEAEQAAAKARKQAEKARQPRKKPGPKPKARVEADVQQYSSDEQNPFGSPEKRKKGKTRKGKKVPQKGKGKYKNYWHPPLFLEILQAIQKEKTLTGAAKLLKRQ